MKITVITAVLNRAATITDAVKSVLGQTYRDIEYIVVDGVSTDGTLDILKRRLDDRSILVSEPDSGIYDALNKGIAMATGEVVALLHSDDYYPDDHVLSRVAEIFRDPDVDAVYGDLDYVSKLDTGRVIRFWKSCQYNRQLLERGWMPPHPTLFLRRRVFETWGGFDTTFKISSDYDAVLRYFGQGGIRAVYKPGVLVKMRLGGESNRSLRRIMRKSYEDYLALRKNCVGGMYALVMKNVSKLSQLIANCRN